MKKYVGEYFLYKNQTWLCTKYIGVDMFEFEHEVTKEKIIVPYTWEDLLWASSRMK